MSDSDYLLNVRTLVPWYRKVSPERWLSIFAVLSSTGAAFFTGWYAIDAHAMRTDAKLAAAQQIENVQIARKAAETSAKTTQSAVESLQAIVTANHEQLKQSMDLFRLDERPRVGFQILLSGVMNVNTGKPTKVSVKVTNTGKTPAMSTRFKSYAQFSESLNEKYPDGALIPGVISLEKDASINQEWNLIAGQPNKAGSGSLRLYVYARVEFADSLGSTTTYSERYCVFYPISKSGDIIEGNIRACSSKTK